MKTLSLFNAVLSKPNKSSAPVVSEDGFIISPNAAWATQRIVSFYNNQRLSGVELNKTFHKSWEKVRNSSRYELYLEQIRHYASTYGTDFRGEVYIPDEVLDVPDLKLTFKVVEALDSDEMIERCLNMLRSGIALKEETITDLLSVLVDELGYTFTGEEGIKNKEAIVKIADLYGVLPSNTMEFFRYCIYRATGDSLLIKSPEVIAAIKASSFNPSVQFRQHGLDRLAEIFNRFKPLFLAFKKQCPATINKISKLSKSKHKPLAVNALSEVTQRILTQDDVHWLDNATPFALFKAISSVFARMQGQTVYNYRIRNGKSWIKEIPYKGVKIRLMADNFQFLMNYLKQRFNLAGTKVFLPDNVSYAVPTSEKMFVGNIPTGTKFYGKKLAVGIYWENEWGARDLDLSAINIGGGKIGWNSRYSTGELTYSGDLTDATNGAVEYMHVQGELTEPYLIMNNVYSGDENSGFKIIIGKGSKVSRDFMMNPNKLLMEVKVESVQVSSVLGILLPEGEKRQCFTLLNFGSGHTRVSGRNSSQGCAALAQQYAHPWSFNDLLVDLGAEVVGNPEKADIDFSLDKLDKDSFIKLFG